MSQIHYEFESMELVLQTVSFALIGEVKAILEDSSEMDLVIEDIKPMPGQDFILDQDSSDYKVGEHSKVPLYSGICWDDPEISPIDVQTQGSLGIYDLKPGMKLFAIPSRGEFEVFEYDEELKEALPLFLDHSKLDTFKENISGNEEATIKASQNKYLEPYIHQS